MAHPDEARPSSPELESVKPEMGDADSLAAAKSKSTDQSVPVTNLPSTTPPDTTSKTADSPVAAPTADVPVAGDKLTPETAHVTIPVAPEGTVAMDPGAITPPPAQEEPHSEYHHPHDPTHDDHYHDPHHGPGADPYHQEYQSDDNYHHHGGGEGEGHHSGTTALTSGGGDGGGDTLEPLFDSQPGEGGPVKPFLEHLEDLRWVIIKVTVATIVGMTFCLFAADRIVALFKWPLERSTHISTDERQHISVMFGPKEVLNFKLATNNLPNWPIATNKFVELELVPVLSGTNQVLTLQVRAVAQEVPFDKAKPLVWLGFAAPFIKSLHIAFFGGLLLAAPFVGFFLVQFILPALRDRERKYFLKAMLPATLLFITGVCLCYFVILPRALWAADQYAIWMGVEIPFLEAGEYFSFCLKFMLGMGAGFEMPVILLALVKIGLLDYAKLAGFRRYMILINLVLGALLTTPEVLTQVAMFIPLQFLYEMTIWIAWYWEQTDRALARRRLAMVIVGFVLLIVLGYLACHYGWPVMQEWLRTRAAGQRPP